MVCSALTYPSQLVTSEVNCGTIEKRDMPYLCCEGSEYFEHVSYDNENDVPRPSFEPSWRG